MDFAKYFLLKLKATPKQFLGLKLKNKKTKKYIHFSETKTK